MKGCSSASCYRHSPASPCSPMRSGGSIIGSGAVPGPVLVLTAVFVMRAYGERSGWLLYPGLAVMLTVSIWDLFSPVKRVCASDTCDSGSVNVRKG
ncbi:hypothetical protein [Paraburkholderia sediminicola]